MDRQQKIDILQNELSRKDLSDGCLCKAKSPEGKEYDVVFRYKKLKRIYRVDEILGHPVILSDVLVWLKGLRIFCQIDGTGMLYIRLLMVDEDFIRTLNRDLSKPYLSEQSDEVIDGLYEVVLLTKKD